MKLSRTNILGPDVLVPTTGAICFTSNGALRKNGSGIMGAGIAKGFRERFAGTDLERRLGTHIKAVGNKTGIILRGWPCIVSLPTKHHWRDKADLNLVARSLAELVHLADANEWKSVYLTKPGCGLGGLSWENAVGPLCLKLLDDRFTVCYL